MSTFINKKHPNVLIWLFLTEMWERFSYYGMSSLLFLYLITDVSNGGMGMSKIYAGQISGIYKALVYITPMLGGYMADKYLGNKKAIFIGAVLMALGHLSLVFENIAFFYLGLGLLIFGNGFFKPNISTLVGFVYGDKFGFEHLRESAFTLFYIGINTGALIGTTVCGLLMKYYGWHYGFGAAGVGMLIGLIVFTIGQKEIKFYADQMGVSGKTNVDHKQNAKPLTKVQKDKMTFVIILAFFTIIFWLSYEQGSTSLLAFSEQYLDLNLYFFELPVTLIQNFNPLFIMILGLPMAYLWTRLALIHKNPSIVHKFIIALLFISLGFILIVFVLKDFDGSSKINIIWIILLFLLHTIGELCLSPIGLSMVSKYSPPHLVNTMMGVFFGAIALANYLGGTAAGFMDVISEHWGIVGFFMIFVSLPLVAAIMLFLMVKRLNLLKHDED
jgi:POT family proton-dependent oligopeptide transporter